MLPSVDTIAVQSLSVKTGRRLNPLSILILGLFVIDFLFGVLSITGVLVERSNLILKGLLQFTIVIIGCQIILLNHAILKRAFTIKVGHQPIFTALLLWTFISIYSGLIGIYANHDISLVIGDLYKFLILPGLFVLFYYAISSLKQIELIFKLVIVIYTVFLLLHLTLCFTGLTLPIQKLGGSPAPAHTLPILYILFYTVLMCKKTAFKFLGWLGILGIFVIIFFFSQGLGSILNILFAPFIFIVVMSKRPIKKMVSIAILLIFIAASLFMFRSDIGNYLSTQYAISPNRVLYKAMCIFKPLPILEKMEIIAAGRISEIASVIYNTPDKLISGCGMGSILTTKEFIPEWRQWAGITSHSMHSAFGETLFRTSVLGMVALLWIIIIFIKKAFLYRRIHPFAILSSAFGIQLLVNYIIGASLASGYLILCLLFVGMLILEEEYKKNRNYQGIYQSSKA